MTSSNGIAATITRGFATLPAFAASWDELFSARAHEPSASFDWTSAMAEHHVKPDDHCFVVALSRGAKLIGLVPLTLRRFSIAGTRVRLLTPLSEEYNTHSDFLLTSIDDDVVRALLEAVRNLDEPWDCFRIGRLLEQSPLAAALRRNLAAGKQRYAVRDGLPAYSLELPESFDSYLDRRSAKFRNHLKRITRKLEAAGEVDVRTLHAGNLDAALDAMFEVERASWKHDHGTAMTAVGRQSGFYRTFVTAAHRSGRAHLQWLTLDGQPIAYNLGYLTAAGYHYLKTSYAHEHRPLSPSTFLRARLIESLIADGVRHFDLPGAPYEWERQWTESIRWRIVISVYSRTVRGRLLAVADRLRHRPSAVRRVVHVDPRAHRGAQDQTA